MLAIGCADAPKPGTDTSWHPATENDSGMESSNNPYNPYASNGSATTTPGNTSTPGQTTPDVDAGSSPSYPSSTSDAGAGTNTPSSPFGDGGLLGGLGGLGSGSGSGAQSGGDGGTATECQNQVCVDVFDCYLWHPDKTNCGFTSCDLGTCK